MGFFDSLNHLWSRADFWNKQENAQQDAAYAAEQERKRREQQVAQQQAARAQASQPRQQQAIQQPTIDLTGSNPLSGLNQNSALPQVQQPGQTLQRVALQPRQPGDMSIPEIAARSAGGVATDIPGGIAGIAKGTANIVRNLATTPHNIKLGLANLFGNEAVANQERTQRNVIYNDPILKAAQDIPTQIEHATDTAGQQIAPWQTEFQKNTVKAVTNLIPFDAALSAAIQGAKGARAVSAASRSNLVRNALLNGTEQQASDLSSAGSLRNAETMVTERLAEKSANEAAQRAQVVANEPVEVAPGIKSTNLARQRAEAIVNNAPTPAVEPTPVPQTAPATTPVVPAELPTLPSLERPIVPKGAVNTGATYQVPQVNPPSVTKAVEDAAKQVAADATKPAVKAAPQEVAPVETAIKAASKQVAETSPPVVSPKEVAKAADNAPVIESDAVKELRGRREALANERDALQSEGMNTKKVDAKIQALDKQIASKTSQPAKVDKAQVEADRRVAEADAQIGEPATTEPRLKTQAQKDAHEKARVDAVKQAEAATAKAKAKTVASATETAPPRKPIAKEVAAQKMQLQQEARDNMTKNGKVKQSWISDKLKSGTNPEHVRSAIEKVEGRKAPGAPIKTKPASGGEIPLSGEKGVGRGAESTGKLYDKTNDKVNVKQGKQALARQGVHKFLDSVRTKLAADENAAFTVEDRNAARELRKKFAAGSEEHNLLSDVIKNVHQSAAQTLATADRVMRNTATHDELVNRLVDRAKNVGLNLTQKDLNDVKARTQTFIEHRSKFNDAQEAYLKEPTSDEKLAALKEAKKTKDMSDKEQKVAELKAIASKSGDKKAQREMYKLIDKLGKEADIWQMDYVDTSLLSSSGTWVANGVNSTLGAIEEGLFGRVGAAIARKRTGTDIGGGNPFTRMSQAFGIKHLGQEYRARQTLPSKNVGGRMLNRIKNYVTTVNELGNTQIDAEAHASVAAEYRNIMKNEYPEKYGKDMTPEVKKELDNLVEYNATVDPRDLRQKYTDFAFKVQGMGSVLGRGGKSRVASFENRMAKGISDSLQGLRINKTVADTTGKLVMRSLIGFPSIVSRSAAQGAVRLAGGVPSFIRASTTADPVERAMLIKQGVKEGGSGAAMWMAGYTAGANGIITGAYPSDKTTQDEWAKEGKSEHSIKIGGSYYSIPRIVGPFAIPFMVGARFGQSKVTDTNPFKDLKSEIAGTLESIGAATPISQMSDNLKTVDNMLTGNTATVADSIEKMGGNMLRVLAPASGLLNEIAQDTSKTQKDTTSDNPVEAILNKLYSGLPGLNQHLPDKTSKDGTVLKNTDPLARAFGAQSTENKDAVQQDAAIVKANNQRVAPIVADKNILGLLDDKTKNLINEANNPKTEHKLNDQNYQTIYKAVQKTTEKLVEKGQWDSFGNVLKMKLSTQEKNKNTPEADKAATKRQITQAKLLKDKNVEARLYQLYTGMGEAAGGSVSDSEFHNMLDPKSNQYDKDLANKLYALDKLFAENGVSGNTNGVEGWKRQKYTLPNGGSGSGSGKSKQIATDFGSIATIGRQSSSGQALKYEALTGSNNPLPNLTASTSKTNLKKKISVTKGVAL